MNPCTWSATSWTLFFLAWLLVAVMLALFFGAMARFGRRDEPEAAPAPTVPWHWGSVSNASAHLDELETLKRQNAAILAELAEARRKLEDAQRRLDKQKWGT